MKTMKRMLLVVISAIMVSMMFTGCGRSGSILGNDSGIDYDHFKEAAEEIEAIVVD